MIEFDYNKNTNKLIIKCESDVFHAIRENFSVENPNAKFLRKRYKFTPLRKYVITPTGQCDIGMFWEIRNYIVTSQITDNMSISNNLKELIKNVNIDNIYKDFKYNLRDYQEEVVLKAMQTGRGTCVLGTGAGKTLTTAALIENYFRFSKNKATFKCLVIVPDLGLVQQTYDEFNSYNLSFSTTRWTGSHSPDLTSNIIICNTAILQSQFASAEWVKFIDLLIVDECHKIKHDNKISKIITKIKAQNKFGFTGTLPEDIFDRWSIIGKLGPVIYEKNSYSLRIENYLSNVEVNILELRYNENIPNITNDAYRDELQFIYNSTRRNNFITKLCTRVPNNTLVLVNHIEHGERLLDFIKKTSEEHEVYFIQGEVEVSEREKIKKIMEKRNNIICIAMSSIFSTGVNIKNLHNIVFAAGGKSFIRTVQSIGRGLRLHKDKDKLHIFDLCDQLTYGRRHSDKRKQIYTTEKIKFKTTSFNLY